MTVSENIISENIDKYNIKIKRESPEWLQSHDISNSDNSFLEVDGGIKYLLVEEQYYVDENKISKYKRLKQQATNMQGVEECSKLLVHLNPVNHKLLIHSISITRDDQIIDRIMSSDIHVLRREVRAEMNIFSGDVTLSILLEDIKINDIIEFSYTILNHNEADAKFFARFLPLEYSVPVHKIYYAVIASLGNPILSKFLLNKYVIKKNISSGKVVYSLSIKNIPAKKIEQYVPYWYHTIASLNVSIKTNWREISKYISTLFITVSMDHNSVCDLLSVKNGETPSEEEIVLSALNFVNNNIRYLANFKATDAIKPSTPTEILKRSYGDCKDFVYLLHNIFSHFNIESYPVLVNTQIGRALNDYLPSLMLFDHVIILVRLDKTNYFIDPTIRQKITSLKNLYLPRYGDGLVCDGVSNSLVCMKNEPPCLSRMTILDQYRVSSWDSNIFILKSEVTMYGCFALRLKQRIDGLSETKFWEYMKDSYAQYMKIDKVIENKLDYIDANDNIISYTLQYQISINSFTKDKNKYSLRVVPIDILEHIYYRLPEEIGSDFYYGQISEIDYDIDIIGPKIKFRGSEEVCIVDDMFKLRKVSKKQKWGVKFKYQFEKLNDVIPHSKYNEFLHNHNRAINILPAALSVSRRSKGWSLGICIVIFIIYACAVLFAR